VSFKSFESPCSTFSLLSINLESSISSFFLVLFSSFSPLFSLLSSFIFLSVSSLFYFFFFFFSPFLPFFSLLSFFKFFSFFYFFFFFFPYSSKFIFSNISILSSCLFFKKFKYSNLFFPPILIPFNI